MKWSSYCHSLCNILFLCILVAFYLIQLLSPVSLAAVPAPNNLWAWGDNSSGQLGNGNNDSNIPVQIRNLNEVVSLAAGDTHVLALKSDGTVWAWGTNFNGELGNGTNIDSPTPVKVSGLTGVIAIAASSG